MNPSSSGQSTKRDGGSDRPTNNSTSALSSTSLIPFIALWGTVRRRIGDPSSSDDWYSSSGGRTGAIASRPRLSKRVRPRGNSAGGPGSQSSTSITSPVNGFFLATLAGADPRRSPTREKRCQRGVGSDEKGGIACHRIVQPRHPSRVEHAALRRHINCLIDIVIHLN